MENYLFFKCSFLSNLFPSEHSIDKYLDKNGIWYTLNEPRIFPTVHHSFAYLKALMFEDNFIATQMYENELSFSQIDIMSRHINNVDDKIWFIFRQDVMKYICSQKFLNKQMKQELNETFPKILVNILEIDNFWGIGYDNQENAIENIDNWGDNVLGQILMSIRIYNEECEHDVTLQPFEDEEIDPGYSSNFITSP